MGKAGRERRGGQFGNTRGKERQRRRADNRLKDPRYRAAMEETRRAQEELDETIRQQQAAPAMGPTEGAEYVLQRREAEAKLAEAQDAEREIERLQDVEDEVEDTAAPQPKFSKKSLRQSGDGNFQFAVTTARIMLKAGYHAEHVLEFTGVGWEDISDIPIDADGFGIRLPDENPAPEGHTS